MNKVEEVANSVTHGVGLFLSIAGSIILVILAKIHGDPWRIASFSVYGSSLIILYAASTLYHSFYFSSERINYIFKIIDHSAIYLLIAGTYTPFALVSLRGAWGWTFFVIIWALALAGITFKMFFVERFPILSVAGYLIMGWLAVIAANPILKTIPLGGIVWLVTGGILYSVGVIFQSFGKLPFRHAIWHLFVLGGSACHYFAILFYVLPA
ncbi:MAG: hemolysin III family protein [Candidatus Omnitrophota bacterium]